MSNPIELYVIEAIQERLVFADTSNNDFVMVFDTQTENLNENKCNVFITALNNIPSYDKYERRISVFKSGTISMFIYAKVMTKINNEIRLTDNLKYKFANQILRILENLELNSYDYEVEDVTYNYKFQIQSPRINYTIPATDGIAEFGINFECYYQR